MHVAPLLFLAALCAPQAVPAPAPAAKPVAAAAQPVPPAKARPSAPEAPRERRVAILVYPNVELLDFAGPGEVFSSAHKDGAHCYRVYTVAEKLEPFESQGFLKVTPEYSIADCPEPDILVVPGGHVPSDNAALIAWVRARSQQSEILLSVCNGALLFGSAGLLANLEVTTHKSALERLATVEPTAKVLVNRRFVDNGRVVTAAGVSAGIDGALHVVARLDGEETAWATARYMEYDWRPDEIAKLHAQPGRTVQSVALELAGRFRGMSGEQALAQYRRMEQAPGEAELNKHGYALLGSGKHAEALALLELATLAFPASANAADSLSEAHELLGDVARAQASAKRALQLLEQEGGAPEGKRQGIRNASASRLARLSGKPLADFPFRCPECNSRCDRMGFLEGGPCPVCRMELVPSSKVE